MLTWGARAGGGGGSVKEMIKPVRLPTFHLFRRAKVRTSSLDFPKVPTSPVEAISTPSD